MNANSLKTSASKERLPVESGPAAGSESHRDAVLASSSG